jgi:hypothetical protein
LSQSVAAALLLPLPLASAAMGWSGLTTQFIKLPNTDPTLPQNQDPITPNVAFTRGSAQGLYNIAQEMFYTPNLSPKGTTWATSLNNPGKTIASTNWANLSFTNWQTAYGGPTQLAGNITNLDAVVHLVANDIYLDLRFDYWGQRSDSGTAFSYFRSSVPEPSSLALIAIAIGSPIFAIRRRSLRREIRQRTAVTYSNDR